MGELRRFGVSVDEELLCRFDAALRRAGYSSRSEAISDLMRQFLAEQAAACGEGNVAAALVMVYDHTKPMLPQKLTQYQHHHHEEVVATLHVHLDAARCFEIIALRGKAKHIKKISDGILSRKGVLFGKLVVASEL